MRPVNRRLSISAEVREAFSHKKGVVALESTVITHGLPYPDNLETARMLENEVREAGAIPATIAVLDGIAKIGLSDQELDKLARDDKALKLSRRDLPMAFALGQNGGTTVATTMMLAHHGGIRVFATGGIGGVHRGAEDSFDISADLEELGRTSVCVVSAGAKAVLDLPKTLEVLETKGVPVIGYQCDDFPAFYYRESGLKNPARLDDVKEIAALLRHKWNLPGWPDLMAFDGGVLIANPVPEKDALDRRNIESAIEQAVSEMTVSGRDVTPYLLAKVSKLTQGQSKLSNIALLKNNARLAAQIATALLR